MARLFVLLMTCLLAFVNLGVKENHLYELENALEEVLAELLKERTGEGSVKINTLEKRVDFERSLQDRREGTLSTLTRSTQTADCTRIKRKI